jgi:hypothetical protein
VAVVLLPAKSMPIAPEGRFPGRTN